MSTTFANQINNLDIYAARAVADKDGNQLDTTYAKSADLATVATSGDYNDLSNKPTIPVDKLYIATYGTTTLAEITAAINAGKYVFSTLPNLPGVGLVFDGTIFPITLHEAGNQAMFNGTITDGNDTTVSEVKVKVDSTDTWTIDALGLAQSSSLATVATSGDYDDLTNKPTIPAAQVNSDWNAASGVAEILNKPTFATVATSGDYDDLSNKPTIRNVPASTSSDEGEVLTVNSQGEPAWTTPPGLFYALYGISTYAEILDAFHNGKVVYCIVSPTMSTTRLAFLAYVGASNLEFQYYRSVSPHSAATQGDEVYVYKVDANGWTTTTRKAYTQVIAGTNMYQSYSGGTLTLNATMPKVNQTYDGTSTNAQSGVAIAGVLATKEDAFDVGTGLEMDTSGTTPTLQVEAPVDIVAGPGIVIDNPDGNTLRVSQAYPTDETVLYENNNPSQITSDTSLNLSESYLHFEKVKLYLRASGGNTSQGSYIVECPIYQSENTEVSALGVVNATGSVMFDQNVFLFDTTAPTTCYAKSNGTRLNIASSGISTTASRGTRIYKIIGIHRIAGGN